MVPLGSMWSHVAGNILFTILSLGSYLVPLGSSCSKLRFCMRGVDFRLGSALGSTWSHVAGNISFTILSLGSYLVPLGSNC